MSAVGRINGKHLLTDRPSLHQALQLGRVERFKRVDVADGLRLLIPLEIAERYRLRCEVHQQKTVLLDRFDSFLHVEMLRWLWTNAPKFGRPAAGART